MRCPPFGITWTCEGPESGLIRWNPCGKAVDMARRPYTTRVRPFRNSDITVKIRWYPARPEDGTLPHTSRICSLDWVTHPETAEGVGEVYGAARSFNRAKPIPGPKRTHVCGTRQEHEIGGIYDPSRPPMIYQPSGLPLCCDPERREAVVPVAVGVRSVASTSKPYRSYITTRALVRSHVYRAKVYRSRVCVCPAAVYTQTVRVDPYRSTVCGCVRPLSLTTRVDPYRSVVAVSVNPVSLVGPSGTSCSDAIDLGFDVPLPFDIGPGTYYFKLPPVSSGQVMHWRRLWEFPQSLSPNLKYGTCDSLADVSQSYPCLYRSQWTSPVDGRLIVVINTDQSIPSDRSVVFSLGAAVCP